MPQQDVTTLLRSWSEGTEEALEELVPMIMAELRRRAAAYLRQERQGHTLQPTALVNEVYLRLVEQQGATWQDRAHFFAVAAQLMRRVLVDNARAHRAEKRGGRLERVELDEARDVGTGHDIDVIALDDALRDLAALDPRQSRVVEMRFFAGLSIEETAEVLGVGHATVSRAWRNARAWLARELKRR